VTAPTERRIKGVSTHRSRKLVEADVATHRGIPITTVARTLVAVAAELAPDDLARACHEAGVKYGTTPRHVQAVLKRRPRCPGAPKLRAIFDGDTPVTLSKLERRFLDLLHDNGLPLPETNRAVGGRRVAGANARRGHAATTSAATPTATSSSRPARCSPSCAP
jgi:hypothetical protein